MLVHRQGWLWTALGLSGLILIWRCGSIGRLVTLLVLATATILSAQPFVVARSISTMIPFLCLGAAAMLAWLVRRGPRLRSANGASFPAWGTWLVVAGIVIFPCLPELQRVRARRSHLAAAVHWLEERGGVAVVAEDPAKYRLHVDSAATEVRFKHGRCYRKAGTPVEAIQAMRGDGVRWVLCDPQRWHYRAQHHPAREGVFHWWRDFEDALSQEAALQAVFPHLSDARWDFLAEGPGLGHLAEMTRRNDGPIRVYDLSAMPAAGGWVATPPGSRGTTTVRDCTR
jgi:hypothetical protein